MKPPKGIEVFETPTSHYWFEDDGILCIVTKKADEISLEDQKKQVAAFKERLGGKKRCAIIDISNSTASSPEFRDYNTRELPELFSAIAFVATSPITRMMVIVYLGQQPTPFDSRVFSNEAEAKAWIRSFLE